MSEQGTFTTLVFYVNGKRVEEKRPNPRESLLSYLRNTLRLCGAKEGCGEGYCGSCTVISSRFNPSDNSISNCAINACLTPFCSVQGSAILTVEGLGSIERGLHPIQERLAKGHGTQCGYCSPGFVMSMHALLRNNPKPSENDLKYTLQGNLCRCTGYRPILQSFSTFCCGRNRGSDCCSKVGDLKVKVDTLMDETQFTPYKPLEQDPIFPPALKILETHRELNEMHMEFVYNGVSWIRPKTMEKVKQLLKNFGNECILVSGGCEIGQNFKARKYVKFVQIGHLSGLNDIKSDGDWLEIGAGVTLNQFQEFCRKKCNEKAELKNGIFEAFHDFFTLIGNQQIRNVGTFGGNLMGNNPSSDLKTVFLPLGTTLYFGNFHQDLELTLEEFLDEKSKEKVKGYILEKIRIKLPEENEYYWNFKQSNRKDCDNAIVNAAFKVKINQEFIVEDAKLAFGGFPGGSKLATQSAKFLIGKHWNWHQIKEVSSLLSEEFLPSNSPQTDRNSYRNSLLKNIFYKFFLQTQNWLGIEPSPLQNSPNLSPFFKGTQLFQISTEQDLDSVGLPIPHLSASKHVTGEAIYVNDIPQFANERFGLFLRSTVAKGRIKSIKIPPDVSFFDSRDLVHNRFGVVEEDEEIFASETVSHYGQILGLIVARNREEAESAAERSEIQYAEPETPAIFTIEDAIRAGSYLGGPDAIQPIIKGDLEVALKASDRVLEGHFKSGGQEHWYLETHACLAVPREGEIELNIATQSPGIIQLITAKALGLAANRVVVKVRRVGGGFGGKETRCAFLGVATAIAARRLGCPVRAVLNRCEDMEITGQRHPFLCKYRVGFNEDGRINGIGVNLYSNAGDSLDWSGEIMGAAFQSVDGAYRVDNFEARGYLCRTNLPSFTSFRGFGRPQGHLICENIFDAVATALDMDPTHLRNMHLYKDGDLTYYGQKILNSNLEKCWSECLNQSNFTEKTKEIKEFNNTNKWRKRGISLIPIKHLMGLSGHWTQAGALVMIYQDGSVALSHGGVEIGQGLNTKMIQVAGRALGVEIDKIYTCEMSTDKVPNATPTIASVSTDLNGFAVLNACEKLKKRLEPLKSQNPGISWEKLIDLAYKSRINLSAVGFYEYLQEKDSFCQYICFGAACSTVEIDALTGGTTILRTDIVFDVGQSLNPAIDIGQIEGAFMQGVGLFTLEDLKYSEVTGELLTKGGSSYKIPTISNIPRELNVSILKGSSNPKAVYSSKAVGEPPFFSAGSVFFAIKDAIRAFRAENGLQREFQLDSPATPQHVLFACENP